MRRAARVDANQSEIVDALRRAGASVFVTSQLGRGFPDAVVGCAGIDIGVEIKDGAKAPSARRLTPAEETHFQSWRGRAPVILENVADALRLVALLREEARRTAREARSPDG